MSVKRYELSREPCGGMDEDLGGEWVRWADYQALLASFPKAIDKVVGLPQYEYKTTSGPRKMWEDYDKPPEGEGWEPDPDRGRPGESWERFDNHEEAYWRRPIT